MLRPSGSCSISQLPCQNGRDARLACAAGRRAITLRRIDAPSKYHATTSYTGNTVNGDDQWPENFAFDDVAAGYYEVEIQANGKKHKEEFWVFAYRTSFVEITLGN